MLGLKWLPGLRHRPLLSTKTANIPGEYSSLTVIPVGELSFLCVKGSAPHHSLFYFNNDGSCGPGEILDKFPPPLSVAFRDGFFCSPGWPHTQSDGPSSS